ncbi:hypothetical protein [Streptomyces himalayensis]|uniref:Uncharacterized protein n=1 Tax=Streptomyces himalayensis subsp. himalayensis TaxID=2756131 RepID=A0A7W0DMI8_9ACTN|nr:hypothetical protein [Streptomyces himalayensis]MBA2947475.1 hypothetical protein [Streptomyces himalayensis subsp. himalayensis]
MDSTSATPGCLPGHTHHHATYAELTDAYWLEPPIYTYVRYPVDEAQEDEGDAGYAGDEGEEPQHGLCAEARGSAVHAAE